MKLNEQLKSYFTKCGHINASFYEGKACINVSLRFRTFYLSLDMVRNFYTSDFLYACFPFQLTKEVLDVFILILPLKLSATSRSMVGYR